MTTNDEQSKWKTNVVEMLVTLRIDALAFVVELSTPHQGSTVELGSCIVRDESDLHTGK
jgi:hypothetical protein